MGYEITSDINVLEKITELTQEYLKSVLDYDPATGVFTRKVATGSRAQVGDVAGTVDAKGYTVFCVLGKARKAHRMAWLYMYGTLPDGQIDHKNTIKSDNRIDNLREATNLNNCLNQG